MFLHLSRHPSGSGFIITNGDQILVEADRIEDARKTGMDIANKTGWSLINRIAEAPVKRRG